MEHVRNSPHTEDKQANVPIQGAGHAVVVGAGICGALMAAALATRYDKVTILERDRLPPGPEPRTGVPQAHHNHFMGAAGIAAIEALLPGVDKALASAGAALSDWGLGLQQWDANGVEMPRFVSGLSSRNASRPLFEWAIHQKLANLRRVTVRCQEEVVGLIAAKTQIPTKTLPRVVGVQVRDLNSGATTDVFAELVVCATGRQEHKLKAWLQNLNCPWPLETEIRPQMRCATRFYKLTDGSRPDWNFSYWIDCERGFVCNLIERDTFLISICDFGDVSIAPRNNVTFDAALAASKVDVYRKMAQQNIPISSVRGWKVRRERIVHFDRAQIWPQGLLIVGDAACNFNPIWGQGMTVCALTAQAFARALAQETSAELSRSQSDANGLLFSEYSKIDCSTFVAPNIAPIFQRQLPAIYADPWWLSATFDLQYPKTSGPRPSWADQCGFWLLTQAAGSINPAVRAALGAAKQMVTPLHSLLDEDILVPVLRDWLRRYDACLNSTQREALLPKAAFHRIPCNDENRPTQLSSSPLHPYPLPSRRKIA